MGYEYQANLPRQVRGADVDAIIKAVANNPRWVTLRRTSHYVALRFANQPVNPAFEESFSVDVYRACVFVTFLHWDDDEVQAVLTFLQGLLTDRGLSATFDDA